MSTIAGMFFMRSGTPGQETPPSGCSVAESENNLSEDDNTSCSASEMGCDLTVAPSSKESSLSSRKNKRKNFKPRNIMEYAGSEEDEDNGTAVQRNRLNHNHHRYSNNNNNNNSIRAPHRAITADEEEENDNNTENDNDMDIDGGGGAGDEGDLEDDVDRPLDLSEVQNDPKFLWRKPELMNPLLSINNNSISNNNNSQLSSPSSSSLQSPQMGNSFVFAPMAMDLRLSNSRTQQQQQPPPQQQPSQHQPRNISPLHAEESFDDQSNDHISSTSSSNAGNHHHHHHGIPPSLVPGSVSTPTGTTSATTAAALTDFAESTMKELLGLYGIAENLRQAGKPSPEIPGMQRSLDSAGQSTKMMLPENMARLLAAMQESVTQAAAAQHAGGIGSNQQNCFNNGSSGSSSNSSNNNSSSNLNNNNTSTRSNGGSPSLNLNVNVSPLSYASINNLVQQHQISSGSTPTKSQLSNNSLNNNNNNNSIFPGHHHPLPNVTKPSSKAAKATGRSPSGRGLTSFPVIREGLLGKGTGPVDYTRYVRRYSNSAECGYQQCRELNYREHFHCLDCGEGTRVFVKKEEMIRHFKWHKKRDESLQHGFMRYSPMDDCSDRFRNCSHNRKQTHYHCLQDGCEKVYISTSDVQMHANYHRKDSAIIQEGFQRFRAAEDCGADHCSFRHQRTTHFHCRRTSCSYTFKNKADMEKHKSYHIKDEQLNRDGFKKFMKHEACHYSNCRFSRVCNHIHCIREGCNYVLHSSGQLYSHKRKHERRDSELAYRKFKLAQSLMRGTFGAELSGMSIGGDSLSLNASNKSEEENSRSSATDHGDLDAEELMKKFLQPCRCDQSEDEHFHCKLDACANALLGTSEIASEHGRNHELEDRISALAYFTVDPASFDAQDSTIPCISAKCPYQTREKHYHCLWDGCSETIVVSDGPFKRLDHFKAHEYTQKLDLTDKCDSLDGFFRRKRGRPPKNRVIEVSSGANEAIFTSFKLPKPIFGGSLDSADASDSDVKDPIGFLSYPEGTTCPDSSCSFNTSTSTCHYHCGHPRCHFSVADVHKLSLHLRDFHTNVDILEGYAFYDKNSDCRESNCEFNGSTEHFHCVRDGTSFLRYTATVAHEAEYHETKSNGSSDDEDRNWNNQIVKASGTFYPLSAVQKKEGGGGADPMDLSSPNGTSETAESKPVTDHSLSRILQLPSPDSGETQYGPDVACGRPFCKLKRKCHFHCHLCNQAFSELEKLRPHVVKHSNFSPLKPANESEEASTDEESGKNDSDDQPEMKLFPKVEREDKGTPPKLDAPSTSFAPTSIQNFLSYPGSHSPYTHLFLQQNPLTSLYAGMMFGGAAGFPPGTVLSPPTPPGLTVPVPSTNGTPGVPGNGLDGVSPIQLNAVAAAAPVPQLPLKVKRPPSASSSSPSSPPENKKQRLQMRILKDEPVPDGYIRFRFNEDCAYTHCGYREHQTHFHCTREDCGYSFCDKTRFVQHTARHERLDTLMGGDFKQYRANISCGRPNCSYVPNAGSTQGQNKASHFHCSKCDFVCTDTNKVVAHRRQHQKLDSIMAAGFEKFTPSQHCNIDACIHAQKQTHYHCLKCSYAVLGLSQMSAHKYRHVD